MTVIRKGDLLIEGGHYVLVLDVDDADDGSKRIMVLKEDVVYELYRHIGTFVMGELVAWMGTEPKDRHFRP